jgi:predicted nucleotidyltransferase/HEPN domain-containing protein
VLRVKTDLSHLAEGKRLDIEAIAKEIRAEPGVDPEMIILFGSYARGDWVEDYTYDGPTTYFYISDYDIFIVVETVRSATTLNKWRDLERRLRRGAPINAPGINLVVHDIDFLNARLREGRYFFKDIREEGVLLYDSGRFELAEPGELSSAERQGMAEEDFGHWFPRANDFLFSFEKCCETERLNIAAFQLHQATESLYAAFLLVHTNYKPRFHDIEKLGKLAAAEAGEMLRVFPRGTDEEKRRFDLLRRAYVDARYNKKYEITREELEWLAGRVHELRSLTESACRRKIEGFSA